MSLVPQMLEAIVAGSGDAAVLHTGETPYVSAAGTETEISPDRVTLQVANDVLRQLLPTPSQQAFDLIGSVRYECPPLDAYPGERFIVVALHEADDVWIEIRREPHAAHPPAAADSLTSVPAAAAAAPAVDSTLRDDLALPDGETLWPSPGRPSPDPQQVVPVDERTIGPRTASDTRDVPPLQAVVVRLLRLVAARGGSALYIAAGTQPSMRVDGEMRALDGEASLSVGETEALLGALMPESAREALVSEERTEWISDVTELGRIRCVSFRDRRGAGGIFRILSAHPATVEQLGLSREMRALALESEGLVLVAGPRSSGKSTLIAALVDLINRTRPDHIITIETRISIVCESLRSVISQREVRGDPQSVLAAARGALREDPDVLVIDEYQDDALAELTLEAAGSGRLVIASLPAHTTQEAIDRLVAGFASGRRGAARLALAENLRGIIAVTLPRKSGGGRVAAREVLLNTPAVASLLVDGRSGELQMAIEAGGELGMVSLNDSLSALVTSNTIDVREAYRCAGDRAGLLTLLKSKGVACASL